MKIVITLGNRLNDDASMTKTMIHRLNLTKELNDKFDIDYFIVSGGIANKKASVSEAFKMNEYLSNFIDSNKIIMEDQSHTTVENALFSIKLAKELNADTIIVCTSIEHMVRMCYNPVKIFSDAIGDANIKLMIYTDNQTF